MAGSAPRTALLADLSTALRAAVAAPLFWFAAVERFDIAAALLAFAWWSDLLDGLLARHTALPTRLGPWDLVIDTLVGSALLAGLISAGVAPFVPWGLAAIALFLGFLVWHNPALGMLVQAVAYGFLLAEVWTTNRPWILVLTATIGGILILDYKRFVHTVLPMFFAGVTGRHSQRPAQAE